MLNYVIQDRKSDKWLVFLHGLSGTIRTWGKQMDEFKEYNLLLIDLPGHGESQIQNFKVNVKNVNKQIKDTLDSLKIKSADFVTLSLGSLVAAYFAVAYPQYVHSLILGGSVLNIIGIYKYLMLFANKIKTFLPYRLMYNVFAYIMMPKKNHALSRKIFARESLKMTKEQFQAWIGYLTTAVNVDELLTKLKKHNFKIFFVSGDEDNCFIKGTKQIERKLQNAKIHIIKHCGHVCSIEKAKEFNYTVNQYLHSLPAAA